MQVHASVQPRPAERSGVSKFLRVPGLAIAWVAARVMILAYRLRVCSFLTSSRLLALVPGAVGIRLRRYWYEHTLASCGAGLVVEWLTALKTADARIGSRVFIGSMCWIAEVDLGDDVMVGSRAAIQGGARTHGYDRMDLPMNQQPGKLKTVTIGQDVWIGTGATVLTDVAPGTVVAAGAVVTSSFPPASIVAGVPARLLRRRGTPPATATEND